MISITKPIILTGMIAIAIISMNQATALSFQAGEARIDIYEKPTQDGAGGYRNGDNPPRPGAGGYRYDDNPPRPGAGGYRYDDNPPRLGAGGYRNDDNPPRPGAGGYRYDDNSPRPGAGGYRYNDNNLPRPGAGGYRYNDNLPRPGAGGYRYDNTPPRRYISPEEARERREFPTLSRNIDIRLNALNTQMQNGLKNGSITNREHGLLRQEHNKIQQIANQMKADRRLNQNEVLQINKMMNRLQVSIRTALNNNERRRNEGGYRR